MRTVMAVTALSAALVAGTGALGDISPATADSTVHPGWGSTHAANAVLRRGCHTYTYAYDITPPQGDWDLQTVITDPRGEAVQSGDFAGNYDPTDNTIRYQLCRAYTKHGTFTITAELTTVNGPESQSDGYLPPSTFYLAKPPPRHHHHHHGH